MYKVGQVIQCNITAIKPYGAFVKTDDGLAGLIHISEISDYFVKDINKFFKKGEKVAVKIIDIDQNGQLKLSLKAIQSNRKYAVPTRKNIKDINQIGFKSLEEKLPIWIEEEMKNEV